MLLFCHLVFEEYCSQMLHYIMFCIIGKDKAMEAKRTEKVKNYEAAMEVGRKNGKSLRCANKRMADELSESESTSSVSTYNKKPLSIFVF